MTRTVLIVEDNPNNHRLAAKLLRQRDYQVMIAEDGETGFNDALENPPDFILMDMGLPDVDGQTVVGMMQQQPTLVDIPIIAFTAWPLETARQMVDAYGCAGIISKPINTRSFVDDIEEMISAARARGASVD